MIPDPQVVSGLFASRYAIEREIGRGATAVVYLAVDTSTGQRVALKVLRDVLQDTKTSAQFLREVETSKGLVHPRIVPMLDSGTADGRPFLVLAYMEEGTLRSRLQRDRQLPFADAIAIAVSIGEALAYAHDAGLIHRDVKPENILFAEGKAHLADFGIARALERVTGDITTSTGVVRGTAAYVSPEQAGGQVDYDGRADIYSLGCVLYEMIAGVPAFVGPNPQSVIAQRLSFPPTQLSQYRDTVPPALEEIVERAMMVSPADRYQSVREMLLALENAGVHSSLPVRRRPQRVMPWRVTTAAAVGALAIAVAAIALKPGTASVPGGVIPEGDARRMAVLYLDALTPDVLPEHIADGITEDLIDRLVGVSQLHVTSPNGVRPFRSGAASIDSIQSTLKVGTIVSGSVARSGNTLRVNVRLIDARTGRQLDNKTLDEQWTELFALQERLAEQVQFWLRQRLGDEIAIRASRAETNSVEAWAAVQLASGETRRAVQAASIRGDTSSSRLFLRADSLNVHASELDPGWVLPVIKRGNLALLALAVRSPVPPDAGDSLRYRALPVQDRRRLWTRHALALAEQALALEPRDARALALRGQAELSLSALEPERRDSLLASAEAHLRSALTQRPDLAVAWTALAELLSQRAQFADAAQAAQRAFDADAFFESRRVLAVALSASLTAELYDDASRWCRLGLADYPGDVRFTECTLRILGSTARSRAAVTEAWAEVARIEGQDTLHLLDATWGYRRLLVAAILARLDEQDSARSIMHTVRQEQPPVAAPASAVAEAYVWMLLGNHEVAVQKLADYMRGSPGDSATVMRHPWFKSLRGDPQLDSLLRRRR
jgi:serine/threonine-protein kinase